MVQKLSYKPKNFGNFSYIKSLKNPNVWSPKKLFKKLYYWKQVCVQMLWYFLFSKSCLLQVTIILKLIHNSLRSKSKMDG